MLIQQDDLSFPTKKGMDVTAEMTQTPPKADLSAPGKQKSFLEVFWWAILMQASRKAETLGSLQGWSTYLGASCTSHLEYGPKTSCIPGKGRTFWSTDLPQKSSFFFFLSILGLLIKRFPRKLAHVAWKGRSAARKQFPGLNGFLSAWFTF